MGVRDTGSQTVGEVIPTRKTEQVLGNAFLIGKILHMNETNNQSQSLTATSSLTVERAAALQRIIGELLPFSSDDRRSLIETIGTFFELNLPNTKLIIGNNIASTQSLQSRSTPFHFSEDIDAPSPKAFILSKSPKTDVERVACLAFYLARYRGTPHFKTKDISALNTESAHRQFSNAAVSVDNASKLGYLVPSVKGSKQLSAVGEQFVEALPDRDAAKVILERFNSRRSAPSSRRENEKTKKE